MAERMDGATDGAMEGAGGAAAPSCPEAGDLRRALLDLAIAGAGLPAERELVRTLAVPRSRLRRVLAELRAEGRIPPAAIGRRAAEGQTRIDGLARLANPGDVIELRMILEPQFARLAAVRASALEIARVARAAASRPGEGYGAADLAFHREVAAASRNPLVRELYDLVRRVGTDARLTLAQPGPPCPKRRAQRDAEHAAVAQAIAARDPDRAEAAMRAHLMAVQAVITARLLPGRDAAAS